MFKLNQKLIALAVSLAFLSSAAGPVALAQDKPPGAEGVDPRELLQAYLEYNAKKIAEIDSALNKLINT